MKFFTTLSLFIVIQVSAKDTLMTHPNYPPITYEGDDYRFFKYTAKYIPKNLLECFKILATCGDQQLCAFMKRSEEEVIEKGMGQKEFRMRKEFCLEGYTTFTSYFHNRGIYYPHAMKTYILLSFHQYLNKERIRWHYNKRLALDERRKLNKQWKLRLDHVFEPVILDEEPADLVDPVFLDPIEKSIYTY